MNDPAAATTAGDSDAVLLIRLRDLALVNVDTLLAGASDEQYKRLLASYSADLCDALSAARTRMNHLLSVASKGPDPLSVVDLGPRARAQDAGVEAGERAAKRLSERAHACRALAVFDDLTGQLVPKLLEVDRRRG